MNRISGTNTKFASQFIPIFTSSNHLAPVVTNEFDNMQATLSSENTDTTHGSNIENSPQGNLGLGIDHLA